MPNLDTPGIRRIVSSIGSDRMQRVLANLGAFSPIVGRTTGRLSTNRALTLARARTPSPNGTKQWELLIEDSPLLQLFIRLVNLIFHPTILPSA
jgi:hypothetical protein